MGLARPEANSLSVASGTLPVAIWNRLEILNNLPRPYFASGKQKSSSEQTTFEYFLQAGRLNASGLCFLPNTLNFLQNLRLESGAHPTS